MLSHATPLFEPVLVLGDEERPACGVSLGSPADVLPR